MWTRKQHKPDREERLKARAARALASATPRKASMARADAPSDPVLKDNPLRSEEYRRLVAMLPCINCGIVGYSQHAHCNEGKGKGLKVDDRQAMPLCCQRPGIEGCHAAFDQYRLFEGREAHREKAREWSKMTREAIKKAGMWPAGLPYLE